MEIKMSQHSSKLNLFASKELPSDTYLQEIFGVMLEAWQEVFPDIQATEPNITALWKDKCCLLNQKRYSMVGLNFDFFIESQTTDPQTGKQIARTDMEVRFYGQSDANSIWRKAPYLVIESKKLNGASNLSKYIGENGMCCFITRKYDSFVSHSAMAGYIVQGTIEKIKPKLLNKIKESEELATQGEFQAWAFLPEYPHNGTTLHLVEEQEITIHHLFLMVVNVNTQNLLDPEYEST
jgi:hypothetical protein